MARKDILPSSEMPMVLTLKEVAPNPDNPRTTRNPKYDDIKASIQARGLDTVPKVTKNPDIPGSPYIFSDGGNTRYAILQELYQETGDERYFRFHVLFKPWPGRLECLVGHLAENDIRGDLTFIDKALGIRKARSIHEEILGRAVTLRELSELLGQQGYPIHFSLIARMEQTIDYLYPFMPDLLNAGFGKRQIILLLSLRSDALIVWKQYSAATHCHDDFDTVFGNSCAQFDDPELYSLEMFRDEFIGALVKALPHPSLNYDRWLLELDPKAQNQRKLFGAPEPVPEHLIEADRQAAAQRQHAVPNTIVPTLTGGTPVISAVNDDSGVPFISPRVEVQPDLLGGRPVLSGEVMSPVDDDEHDGEDEPCYPTDDANVVSLATAFATSQAWTAPPPALSSADPHDPHTDITPNAASVSLLSALSPSTVAFANVGLEPVVDIWAISALQDDVEHLQDMAYRLAFELAEASGCCDDLTEDKALWSAGYRLTVAAAEASLMARILSAMTGEGGVSLKSRDMTDLMLGTEHPDDSPVFDDILMVKFLRLLRVVRRLREWQRQLPVDLKEGVSP